MKNKLLKKLRKYYEWRFIEKPGDLINGKVFIRRKADGYITVYDSPSNWFFCLYLNDVLPKSLWHRRTKKQQ